MASLRDLPPYTWLGIAGGIAVASAGAIPNERTAKVVRALGVAGVAISFLVGAAKLAELFGFKKEPRIEEITDETIDHPNAGASFENHTEETGGIVSAKIDEPSEGTNVDRSSLFGGTYSVRVKLASSMKVAKDVRLRLVSDEFYYFGGNDRRVTDLGVLEAKPGATRTIDANVDVASEGFSLGATEVALTLEMDGKPVDVVRFTYS